MIRHAPIPAPQLNFPNHGLKKQGDRIRDKQSNRGELKQREES